MNIILNSKPVDALSIILHRTQAEPIARDWVKRLKGLLSRQLFEIVIQAAIGNKVIAREGLSAMRKNVTAKCYGGDVSRKMKLLNKQASIWKKKGRNGGTMERTSCHTIVLTSFSRFTERRKEAYESHRRRGGEPGSVLRLHVQEEVIDPLNRKSLE